MKIQKRSGNIFVVLAVLTLLFLFTFSVTYAYFTSNKSLQGNIAFAGLDVKFAYKMQEESSWTPISDSTFTVKPDKRVVLRGDTFNYMYDSNGDEVDEQIYSLAFFASSNSCSSYVRLRVDAYIVEEGVVNKTVNYGQYFKINFLAEDDFQTKTLTVGTITNNIYYKKSALLGSGNAVAYEFSNSMTLLENSPDELLQKSINVSMYFEAVQSTNSAFKFTYNDGWGYCDSWT